MIGIFGDSFAECLTTSLSTGWPLLLRDRVSEKVIIEAAGGSSLYWSYKNFIRLQHECDKIIFIVTNPTRYTQPVKIRRKSIHLNSISTIERLRSIGPFTEEEESTLDDLTTFYRIMDIDYDVLCCQMLVERILKIRPDTILVPINPNNTSFPTGTTSMYDFVFYQIKCLGMPMSYDKFFPRYTENSLACHFTDEINSLVCDMMLQSLEEGKWIGKIPNTLIPHAKPFTSYYTRNNTK